MHIWAHSHDPLTFSGADYYNYASPITYVNYAYTLDVLCNPYIHIYFTCSYLTCMATVKLIQCLFHAVLMCTWVH